MAEGRENGKGAVDVAIIGAGSAGVTAAIYALRNGLKTRIFDGEREGGMTADAVEIENYPGAGKISGKELMDKFLAQMRGFGGRVEGKEISAIVKKENKKFEINAGDETFEARTVIIATGTRYKKLGVPGEAELKGKGVSYCAVCDGAFFRERDVVVVGGGNTGVTYALYLAEICKSVALVEFEPELCADKVYLPRLNEKKVRVLANHGVVEILDAKKGVVEGVRIKAREGGREEVLPCAGVFVSVGLSPNNALAKAAGVEIDGKGFVKVNRETMETSIPGIFAAGDINGGVEQTVVAAGEGAVAAVSAFRFLQGAGE
ncbi:FAD-dependent oxidoreductase [Candidatus Micrarchaeota archaeon]|nr:FAD-dependent oxidoreductase [Candidatus Micrarchaeota archaeon]